MAISLLRSSGGLRDSEQMGERWTFTFARRTKMRALLTLRNLA